MFRIHSAIPPGGIGATYTVSLGAVVGILAALAFNRRRPVVVAALRQIMEAARHDAARAHHHPALHLGLPCQH